MMASLTNCFLPSSIRHWWPVFSIVCFNHLNALLKTSIVGFPLLDSSWCQGSHNPTVALPVPCLFSWMCFASLYCKLPFVALYHKWSIPRYPSIQYRRLRLPLSFVRERSTRNHRSSHQQTKPQINLGFYQTKSIQVVAGQKLESDHAWLSFVTGQRPNPPSAQSPLTILLRQDCLQ